VLIDALHTLQHVRYIVELAKILDEKTEETDKELRSVKTSVSGSERSVARAPLSLRHHRHLEHPREDEEEEEKVAKSLAGTHPPVDPHGQPRPAVDEHVALTTPRRRRRLHARDPPLAGVAIWNGSTLTPVGDDLRNLMGDIRLAGVEEMFLTRLKSNYAARGAKGTFASINEFLSFGSLQPYANVSARTFFNRAGVPQVLQEMVLEPLSRGIYDQELDEMQAFSAIVSVTSLLGAASFDGGNSLLVELMFNHSGADVRLSNRVVEVVQNPPSSASASASASLLASASPMTASASASASLVASTSSLSASAASAPSASAASGASTSTSAAAAAGGGFSIKSFVDGHNVTSAVVDAVIIASPIEFTGITFPPTVKIPQPRPFKHIWVTIVRAAGLDPVYFGLPAGTNVTFDNVLTTRQSSASTPFVVVESEGEAAPVATALTHGT
jgi:hypothetical protein